MTPIVLLPALAVFCAGALLALQAPTNAMLARVGGSPVLAALISFAIGTIALFVAWLSTSNRPVAASFTGLPWYAWCGGFYGAFFVAIAAYAAPRIGLGALIMIGIAGQIAMAIWLDHLGALGLPREPINLGRITGALLVFAGVVVARRS